MRFKLQLIFSLVCINGLLLYSAPQWWLDPDYRLIDPAETTNDNALALQGQAKQAFAASKSYFDDELFQFGGAGENVNGLFGSTIFTNSDYDYHVLLNGQLKSLAHPFYLRLDDLGIPLWLVGFGSDYTGNFPWTDDDPSDDADNSPALIGQVKYAFSFDLSLSQDGDSIPDWWEYVFATDPSVDTNNSTTDTDGDSRLDSVEYLEKTDPTDYYDGTLPNLTIVSGDGQEVLSGAVAAEPVIVQVDDATVPLGNAPLEISLLPIDSGSLEVDGMPMAVSISARTNSSGEIAVDFHSGTDFEGPITINFLAQSGGNQTSVQAILNVLQNLQKFIFTGVYQTYVLNGVDASGAGLNRTNQFPGQSEPLIDQFSELSGLPAGIVKIVTGPDHVLGLTSEGSVYAWGDNFFGQLGLGDFQGRSVPALIASLNNVVDVSAGDGFSSFLVDNGDGTTTVYLSGDLKDGLGANVEISNLPVVSGQPGHPDAVNLAASGRRLLILCEDGSVWGWGQNSLGQVDPASPDLQVNVATEIVSSGAVSVSASPDNSLAILDTGELKAWGNAAFEQLTGGIFDPSTGIYSLAIDVVHAIAGNGFIAYLDESNNLSTAGLNDAGQLGRDTGGAMIATAGTVVSPATDTITTIASGDRHLVYLTEANDLYGFGDNSRGALGAGATSQLTTAALLTPNLN